MKLNGNTSKTFIKIGAKLTKHGPTVLTIVGVVGVGVGMVLTWKASRKHDDLVNDIIDDMEEVHAMNPNENPDPNSISKDANKVYTVALIKAWGRTAWKVTKVYAAPILVTSASLLSIIMSHKILMRRYSATLAACSLAEQSLMLYRSRVAEKYGEETENKLWLGIDENSVETVVLDKDGNPKIDKNGEVKTKTEKHESLNKYIANLSPYAMIFDRNCSEFKIGDDVYNQAIVESTEKYCNAIIRARASVTGIGVMVLNEVRERFGIGKQMYKTKAGQVTGWVYMRDKENAIGDNYIKLHAKPIYDEETGDTIYVMDPNVCGNILGYIEYSL